MDKPPNPPELFSVPRRFDLATVLVATTAAAVLFAAMSLANFRPASFGIVAGLFAAVAIGQAIGARANRPRLASMVAATLYWAALGLVLLMWGEFPSHTPLFSLLCWLAGSVIYGIPSGYVAGVLDAGVFLASHHLRGALKFARRRPDAEHGESPWDESP